MRLIRHYINSHFLSSDQSFDVTNPATQEVIAREPLADAQMVERANASADEALSAWQLNNRARYLNQIANLLETHKRDFAQAEAMDTGKPMSLSLLADIPLAIEAFRQAAQETELEQSRVVAVLSSWVSPLLSLSRQLAPLLAQGCTAVVSPSPLTPVTAHRLSELLARVELPPGVCNIVYGLRGSVVKNLSASDVYCDGPGFESIHEYAPEKNFLIRGQGSGVAVVFNDCDFDSLIENLVRGCFVNQGQMAESLKCLFIEKPLYDRVYETLLEIARDLPVGDPLDRKTFVGALISPDAFRQARKWLQEHHVVVGGDQPQLRDEFAKGSFLNPAIVIDTTDVPPPGPIATITPFVTLEELREKLSHVNNICYLSLWGAYRKDDLQVSPEQWGHNVWAPGV